MRKFFHENGLSLALLALFVGSLAGQIGTGFIEYNDDLRTHRQALVGFAAYLGSGHFIEALFENWESEFLQMGMFLVLTQVLHQKGSAESRKLDHRAELADEDEERRQQAGRGVPWPVRRGGWIARLYAHSLTLVFFALFAASFTLHAYGGALESSREQEAHGLPAVTMLGYLSTARFWFESFQNWQSEFISIFAMIVLSIWLRADESPESKRVDAPHGETGA